FAADALHPDLTLIGRSGFPLALFHFRLVALGDLQIVIELRFKTIMLFILQGDDAVAVQGYTF
ncbi:hypothetical protein, partial [Klebsiella pneumoniae]|uniref:hypothetical protein n=1 Tax=Klebsiella pneumoniae TaxID=573 RepID=UPI003C6CFFD9